jgi:GNAT superfamily N-acetyltransferase
MTDSEKNLILLSPALAMFRYVKTSMLAYYLSMLFNPAASLRHNLQLGNDDEKYNDPSYEEPGEAWGINEIAVAPDFQRHGIGMRLLQWGIDCAIYDSVPVTLTSTPAGVRLYERAGFRIYGTWKWAKKANETYTMMRWDPPQQGI